MKMTLNNLRIKLMLLLVKYSWLQSIILTILIYKYFYINSINAEETYEQMFRRTHNIPERTPKEELAYLQSIIDREERIQYWIPKVLIAIPVVIFIYATVTYFIPK